MNERQVRYVRHTSTRVLCFAFCAACASSKPSRESGPASAGDPSAANPGSADASAGAVSGARDDAATGAAQAGNPAIGSQGENAARDAAPSSFDADTAAATTTGATTDAAASATQSEDAVVRGATSCFGRCGAPELLAIAGACACDLACLERGDCCADKHEWCAVAEQAPICALTGPGLDPACCGSDLGWSFLHEGQHEILFGDTYAADCSVPFLYDDAQGRLPSERPSALPDRPPANPISCGRLLDLDTPDAGNAQTFSPMRLFEAGQALSSWLGETPLTGFSDGERACTLFRRGPEVGGPLYVAVRDASAAPSIEQERSVYRVVQEYATRHFQNPTATGVAHFDPQAPFARDDTEGNHTLFLWGRDHFWGDSARPLYFAYQPLPIEAANGSSRWAPRYFAGLVADEPTWSEDESKAAPVLTDDFDLVLQLEVAWIAELDKWVMLYGGDIADSLYDVPNAQPRHGALHMRMASHPWGPWTRATPVFWREHAARFLHCDAPAVPPAGVPSGCDVDELPDDPLHSYDPGSWGPELRDFVGCVRESPAPRSPAIVPGTLLPCDGEQRGNLYAPNLLVPWTVDHRGEHGYGHAATLYFNVSTWSPYQVILAALAVYLP